MIPLLAISFYFNLVRLQRVAPQTQADHSAYDILNMFGFGVHNNAVYDCLWRTSTYTVANEKSSK